MRFLRLAGVLPVMLLVLSACASSASDGAAPTDADSTTESSDAIDSDSSGVPVEQNAPVNLTGDKLDPIPQGITVSQDAAADPVIGTVAPTLSGTDFDGNERSVSPDGRNKVVMFLAHWCPHCQTEVKLVSELVASGQLPENVDLYAVTIAVSAERDNYPPSEWLEREGFPGTVVRDSVTSAAADAYGVGAIPYVVYLDGDNTVLSRSSGSLDSETILRLWLETAAA